MKRFFKMKRNKSPKPPQQPISPERPADTVAGPPDFREVDVTPDVERDSPEADRTDLVVPQNEGEGVGSRVVFQDRTDGDEELPASGASTSAIAIGGDGYRNQPTSECS